MIFVFSPDQDIKGAKFLEANNYMFFCFFFLKIYNLFVTYYEIISILVEWIWIKTHAAVVLN